MTVIIGQAQGWQSGAAYIGYVNELARKGVVMATSSEAEEERSLTNIVTWDNDSYLTTDKNTVEIYASFSDIMPIDAFGIYGHNLSSAASIELAYSNNFTGSWTDVALTVSRPPATGGTIFVHFVNINARYWRVTINNTEANVRVTNLFIGQALQLYSPPEIGWTPIGLGRNNKIINSKSDGGKFIGRSLIERGNKARMTMSVVPSQWVRDHWLPFMVHSELGAFYFAWDAVHEPSDAAYCYTDKMLPHPSYKAVTQMSVSLSFIAL